MEKHDEELVSKAVNWVALAAIAIHDSGGYAPGVLKQFSKESLEIMVRNDLFIIYKKRGATDGK